MLELLVELLQVVNLVAQNVSFLGQPTVAKLQTPHLFLQFSVPVCAQSLLFDEQLDILLRLLIDLLEHFDLLLQLRNFVAFGSQSDL